MASEKRLIDANMLMNQVKAIHRAVDTSGINTDYDTGFHSATSQVQGLIAYMPTVDAVEVVHGRCVYVRDDELTDHWECSVCGRYIPWEYHLDYNYCPWCGRPFVKENNNG